MGKLLVRSPFLFALGVMAFAATACGGDSDPEPQPLVADPAVQTGCMPEALSPGQVRAKFVDCLEERPAGVLASGRVGDVVLENANIEVVVRAFGEGYYLIGTNAGGIVDAAPVGGVDAIKEVQPLFELNGGGFDEFVITEAGDDGPATLVVRGPTIRIPFVGAAVTVQSVEAIVEQHYVLEADATEVQLRTYLFPIDGAEGNVTVGNAMFYGGAINSWIPRTGIVEGTSTGELIASVGDDASYGVVYDGAQTIQLADIANVKLALGTVRTLGNAEPVDQWFIVGDGSVSSVTDRAWALLGTETGTISGTTAPDVDVWISDATDRPFTLARSDESGAFSADVPVGAYKVWTQKLPARKPAGAETVAVSAGQTTTVAPAADGTGTLSLTVEDEGTQQALPSRVVVYDDALERYIFWTGDSGALTIDLAPGDYTVDISRGTEYTAFTANPVTITDGQDTPLAATLERVVDTSGWIAIDTHIHSEMSTDSQVRLHDRLLSIAAEGIEIALSTDHDFITDYNPVIEQLGLGDWLAHKSGVEVSSLKWGHINTWPHTPDYDTPAGGAFPWWDRIPGDVFALMRERNSDCVIQVNHPRASSSGLFNAIGIDPATLTTSENPGDIGLPGESFDDLGFDAVEVANDFNTDEFEESFTDWIQMVEAGHPAAATGSSDSHGESNYIGNSRTYVYVGAGNDTATDVDLAAVDEAIKARKVVVSQGAFITAEIIDPDTNNPSDVGALVDLSGESEARVHVKVQAAPWMPLDRIEVYHGSTLITSIDLNDSDTAAVRYDSEMTIPIDADDGFFVFMARPAGAAYPVFGTPVGSFTNPIRYDGDGDQMWAP